MSTEDNCDHTSIEWGTFEALNEEVIQNGICNGCGIRVYDCYKFNKRYALVEGKEVEI